MTRNEALTRVAEYEAKAEVKALLGDPIAQAYATLALTYATLAASSAAVTSQPQTKRG